MIKKKSDNLLKTMLFVFAVCFILRLIEYFLIRTDQGFFGEAFIHKLGGIIILAIFLRLIGYQWATIGFQANNAIKQILFGLFLGAIVFTLAYGTEMIIQFAKGSAPQLRLYVTSYALEGNQGRSTSILLFIICIIGNIINVIMEEGVFRGFFLTLGKEKYSFGIANMISCLFFGFWHIVAPLRSYLDGKMDISTMIINALILIVMTGLMGIKLGMLAELTGSLWAPMADHFVNNTVINLLHVVSTTGADDLQMIRISIAQTVSFFLILTLYFKFKKCKVYYALS